MLLDNKSSTVCYLGHTHPIPTQSQIANFATWDKSTPPPFLPFFGRRQLSPTCSPLLLDSCPVVAHSYNLKKEISNRTKLPKRQKIGLTLQWPCIALPNNQLPNTPPNPRLQILLPGISPPLPHSYLLGRRQLSSTLLSASSWFLVKSLLSWGMPWKW